MKKFIVLAVAALMLVAMTVPASALENIFGGYWRTRAFTEKNFAIDKKTEAGDIDRIDTRTRLYYTAKFSDNLKFVNQFEMNAVWGGAGTYGQLGADGANVVVKRSYVDFNLQPFRFELGIQNFELTRGYLFADDAAGIKAIFKLNDGVYLPLIYMKAYEGGAGKIDGNSADDYDVNAFIFYPTIFLNKTTTLKPHVATLFSDNYSKANTVRYATPTAQTTYIFSEKIPGATKLNAWTGGLEFDTKMDAITLGATGIFEWGSVDVPIQAYGHDKLDFKGYLFDLFGAYAAGPANLRLKGIYSSGNDKDSIANGKIDAFFNPGTGGQTGASYYWAEIMGLGIFDLRGPAMPDDPKGVMSDKITNRIIGNLGVDFKVLPDLKLAADLWYAKTAKEVRLADASYDDKMGTELDVVLTYKIVDNLNLNLVGAYLWAGDAINKAVTTDEAANPYEFGAQLSLAF